MEWFIKKNATLPTLKVKVVKDGRSDFEKVNSDMLDSSVYFSMINTETQTPKISTKSATTVSEINSEGDTEYYAYYQFTKRDTNKEGRFSAEFMIINADGVIYLPINDKLYVNIIDSFAIDDVQFKDNYTINFPCCD